ncbi:hypothetical protein MF408_23480 [Nocardioides sp. TF02-7]|nr:hypothetical protein [Nocardioides sp. TF02-7]UMG92665.1 hypothetical protein MF408_23480 [Nocardioides sp. TF02-7]
MTDISRDDGPHRPVLRTDADVTTMWRTILQPLGWHTRRLYLLLVDPDRRPRPGVVEIDGIPATIAADEAAEVVRLLAQAAGDTDPSGASGSAAVLLARPGGEPPSPTATAPSAAPSTKPLSRPASHSS